jgi:hypothetical protein
MRKIVGFLLFLLASWMLISPQALIGLTELKWMYKYSFAGEILLGALVICIAYYLLDFKPGKATSKPSH